jgi:hypothetical protein
MAKKNDKQIHKLAFFFFFQIEQTIFPRPWCGHVQSLGAISFSVHHPQPNILFLCLTLFDLQTSLDLLLLL